MQITRAQVALALFAPLKNQPLPPGVARITANSRDHGIGWFAKVEFARPEGPEEPDETIDRELYRRERVNRVKYCHGRSRADAINKAYAFARDVLMARQVLDLTGCTPNSNSDPPKTDPTAS